MLFPLQKPGVKKTTSKNAFLSLSVFWCDSVRVRKLEGRIFHVSSLSHDFRRGLMYLHEHGHDDDDDQCEPDKILVHVCILEILNFFDFE